MAMASFGHPVKHQDAREKPVQTQKTNRRGIMSRSTMSTMKKYIKYINMNIQRIYKELEAKTIRK